MEMFGNLNCLNIITNVHKLPMIISSIIEKKPNAYRFQTSWTLKCYEAHRSKKIIYRPNFVQKSRPC